jgi:hypothetical protein
MVRAAILFQGPAGGMSTAATGVETDAVEPPSS